MSKKEGTGLEECKRELKGYCKGREVGELLVSVLAGHTSA